MPTVPYNPIPQEVAGGSLSEQNVRVSEASFGGELARAISGLGKTVEGVGDQIYQRAIWLQNLHNQAEARNADAKFITESGKLQAEFNSLEGDQALKAYPKYQEKLKALRGQIRSGLTTRGSQEMFDGQTLGTLSRAVFNGASHTAAAQKKFVIDSMEAQRTAIREEAGTNPLNSDVTERAVRRTEQSVREEGRLRGAPPEAIDNNVKKYTSAIYATQIETVAKEFPLQGPTELSRLREKLTLADFKRVETVVNNQRDAYGSAKIATDLISAHTDEDGDLTVPMADLQAKARKLAKEFSPDDPAFETKTERALNAEFNQRKYARKQENFDNRETVANGIVTNQIANMEQLLADPKLSAAYYALPKSEQLKIPGRIDNYIKARDRQYNEQAFTKLMGLSNNDVEGFLNVDPTDEKYKLSQAQIRQVQDRQGKIKRSTSQDPRVDRAMSWMRGAFGAQMEAMRVHHRTKQNKEDYDHLTGAVQQALDLWIEDKKKPPTQAEFNEKIAPQILKTSREPGMFGIYGYGVFGTDRPFFRHDTSSKEYKAFVQKAKEDLRARGLAEPHDEELYKAFSRLQLMKLYPPKGATGERP